MIRVGTKVQWKWSGNYAKGTVVEIYYADISKTIDGTEVSREATAREPAYLIKQSDGQRVLKSTTEVSRVD